MSSGIDNVMARINQINERIREIQAMGKKALYNSTAAESVNSAGSSSAAGESGQISESAFADALEQAMLADVTGAGEIASAFDLDTADNTDTESVIGIDDLSAINRLGSDLSVYTGSTGVPSLYANIINLTSSHFGVDSNLIKAVIKQESDFNPSAVSSKGAMGLMQLMPETAKDLGVDDAFDPAKNIYGGTKYLKQMLNRYKGDLDVALAAYNAGPTTVDNAGGIPEITETKNYIAKVRQYYQEYAKNPRAR